MMLRCNMSTDTLQLGLDDLLADLRHARRVGDLGRLAFIAYCEVRRWARMAGAYALAEHASEMFTSSPHASKAAFLEQIDTLIAELEQVQSQFVGRSPHLGSPDAGRTPADLGAGIGPAKPLAAT